MRNYLGARRRFNYVHRVFSLTRQEQALIVCILLSVLVGSLVKHYREIQREKHSAEAAAASPTPSLRAKNLYVIP
jgi:hypothetical protein